MYLIRNVHKPLGKSVSVPLGLRSAADADAAMQKKIYGSGTTALIISNEEVNDMWRIWFIDKRW